MGTIQYSIVSGEMPVTVELIPSLLSPNVHDVVGTYQFENVPNGIYDLKLTDSNGCIVEKQLVVNPFISTTTTTVAENDWMIVGQTIDPNLIFDVNGTNRNDKYVGYPDQNVVELYLWFKTLNGEPIVGDRVVNYVISGNTESVVTYNNLSDEIHSEVIESVQNNDLISGNIIFKTGFIESFFKYTIDANQTIVNYVNVYSTNNWISSTNIPLININSQYGVNSVNSKNIIMNF